MDVSVPSVLFSITVFGPTLDAEVSGGGASAVAAAFASFAGVSASSISFTRSVEYVLSFVLALPGVTTGGNTSAAVSQGLASALPGAGMTVQVEGVSTVARRRLHSTTEATVFAYSSRLASAAAYNASLLRVVTNGSLTTALQSAGVATTGVTQPTPPTSGAQFGVQIVSADATAAAQLVTALSPSALASSTQLQADLNAAGLGTISSFAITQAPTMGACTLQAAQGITHCTALAR